MSRTYLLVLMLTGLSSSTFAQKVVVKTNLLYGVYAHSPNLGLEIGLNRKTTLDLNAGYNAWHLENKGEKKQVHWLAQVEYRYWLCQRFNGHFLGIHALGSQFNINKTKLPLLLGKDSDKYRYEGYATGAGISYGYQWILGTRWNLEANIGVGYARLVYDKYQCTTCGSKIGKEHRNYLGPTKAGISIIYLIK